MTAAGDHDSLPATGKYTSSDGQPHRVHYRLELDNGLESLGMAQLHAMFGLPSVFFRKIASGIFIGVFLSEDFLQQYHTMFKRDGTNRFKYVTLPGRPGALSCCAPILPTPHLPTPHLPTPHLPTCNTMRSYDGSLRPAPHCSTPHTPAGRWVAWVVYSTSVGLTRRQSPGQKRGIYLCPNELVGIRCRDGMG